MESHFFIFCCLSPEIVSHTLSLCSSYPLLLPGRLAVLNTTTPQLSRAWNHGIQQVIQPRRAASVSKATESLESEYSR